MALTAILYDLRLAQEKAGKSIKALPTLKRRELVHEGIQLYPCAALLAFWHRADDGLIFSGGQDAQIFTQQPRTAKVGLAKTGSCSLCSLVEIAGGQTCHTLA
jgi:hypothetical protein